MKEKPKKKMGRPREHDKEEVAEKLIEWAQLEDSTNLNGFTAWYPGFIIPEYITRWAKSDENFCHAYRYAMAMLAHRREKKLRDGELHVKAYDLNATVYDHYLKQDRREEKEFEAKIRADANSQELITLDELKNRLRENSSIKEKLEN